MIRGTDITDREKCEACEYQKGKFTPWKLELIHTCGKEKLCAKCEIIANGEYTEAKHTCGEDMPKEKCGLCGHDTPCPHSRLDKALGFMPKEKTHYCEACDHELGGYMARNVEHTCGKDDSWEPNDLPKEKLDWEKQLPKIKESAIKVKELSEEKTWEKKVDNWFEKEADRMFVRIAIRTLLAEQKQEILDKAEKLKDTGTMGYTAEEAEYSNGRDSGIESVIDLIKSI